MNHFHFRFTGCIQSTIIALVILAGCLQTSFAQTDKAISDETFSDEQLEFFENKVRPLLVEFCFECHGPDSKPIEGSLSLASRKHILAGGDTGPAITPNDPDNSLLIDAINYGEVYEMPPDTKMSDENIAILTKWVKDGAAWPAESEVEVNTKSEFDIQARKKAHWVWQPIKKKRPPKVSDSSWPKDPIDNFILDKLEQSKLTPASPADRSTLIRRAYFDLTGLPPTRDEIQAFVNDKSENAFEKVIDTLIASPHFGERWARHWLDLSRYAETGGHEFDYTIKHAYRYRDYLIRAFNADVSYKQLIHEHIAGDLLPKPRLHPTEQFNESVIATGFWFLGEAKHAPVDAKDEEARTIDNQIDVMTKSFLAMTVACARCHDHKFDAISTEDYYAMSGFLQSSRRQEAMLDPGKKIAVAFNETSKSVVLGNEISKALVKQLAKSDSTQFAKYLSAAIEVVSSDPSLNKTQGLTFEGETLKQKSVSGGETLPQEIQPRGQFAWRGNKQYWWKHPKKGDTWELEFNVPKKMTANNPTFKISGVFTKAGDYGSASISINDQTLQESVDFYAPELTTTGLMTIGELKLKPGKNIIKFTCTGNNEKAAPSRMIGLDYLQVFPVNDLSDSNVNVEKVAKANGLDLATLNRLTAAIKHPSALDQSHPFNLVRSACSNGKNPFKDFSARLAKKVESQIKQHEKWKSESKPFADFSNGLPADWFQTGFAFGDKVDLKEMTFSAAGKTFQSPSTVSSGRFGKQFYGVVRSPTFELNDNSIHYRYRGNDCRIRLIIDGYSMDEFNALLFSQCSITIKPSETFKWRSQSGDLKHQLGRRAHIEIIDHGAGHIELDEIRMSNNARPVDPPDEIRKALAGASVDSKQSFCDAFAKTIVDQIGNTDLTGIEIANCVIENQLFNALGASTNKVSSNSANRTTFVSINSDSTNGSTISAAKTAKLFEQLIAARKNAQKVAQDAPAPQMALAITDGTSEDEFIFIRGNHKTLGDVATRKFLTAISPRPLNPPNGSGRLLLAQKMTALNNPLTARVGVNRLWHHLFGRGIVESVDNFGVLGKRPTHPELLDYLAKEFASDGWSVKRMVKRMMLTQTYQMASTLNPDAKSIDPDNNLLHRSRIRRLQGEAIRDSMLSISGRLDKKMFGPPIPIYLTEFMSGRGRPGKSGPLDGAGRRTIYIAVRRNFLSPMMLAFDTPIPFNAIGKRNASNVPAQALILMNDPFVIDQAKVWSERLVETEQTASERINLIYWAAIGRAPTDNELASAEQFIELQSKELNLKPQDAKSNVQLWQDFCHVVFNLKEFIYIK